MRCRRVCFYKLMLILHTVNYHAENYWAHEVIIKLVPWIRLHTWGTSCQVSRTKKVTKETFSKIETWNVKFDTSLKTFVQLDGFAASFASVRISHADLYVRRCSTWTCVLKSLVCVANMAPMLQSPYARHMNKYFRMNTSDWHVGIVVYVTRGSAFWIDWLQPKATKN